MFQVLDTAQSQGSIAFLYASGFEPGRAVPAVGDLLCLAVISVDNGGHVCCSEGPGQCKVLQVPGASTGDGDVLTFS